MLSRRCCYFKQNCKLLPCLKFDSYNAMVKEIDYFISSIHEGRMLLSDGYKHVQVSRIKSKLPVLLILGSEVIVWEPRPGFVKMDLTPRQLNKSKQHIMNDGALKSGYKIMYCIREFCHRVRVEKMEFKLVVGKVESLLPSEAEILSILCKLVKKHGTKSYNESSIVLAFHNSYWVYDSQKLMDDESILACLDVLKNKTKLISKNKLSKIKLIYDWEIIQEALCYTGNDLR